MTLISPNAKMYKDVVPTTFSDLIENFFKDNADGTKSNNAVLSFSPKVDIAETETQYELSLLLAGIAKEDIKIDFQDGKLVVSGERKLERKEAGKKYHKIETPFGSFYRTFALPEKTSHEAIEASYNNGILKIVIPKEEKKTLKTTIEVK